MECTELHVDESSLTGESHPVVKTCKPLPATSSTDDNEGSPAPPTLTQQQNIVFAGTLVNSGRGRALVLRVGESTELGTMATELDEVEERRTPLQNNIDNLGQMLAGVSSAVIAIVALLGVILGRKFMETLTVAISLAVAAIPEGLPICVTVTLALGVLRMAQRNAIVKKLPVVESLGCATAICSDKTGTLTQNQMTVRSLFTLSFPDTDFEFTGVGYAASSGSLFEVDTEGDSDDDYDVNTGGTSELKLGTRVVPDEGEKMGSLSALLHAACLCNNGRLVDGEQQTSSKISGQPTEVAILAAAAKAGVADSRPKYDRIHEVPFTSERKIMTVRAKPIDGHVCEAFDRACGVDKTLDSSLDFLKGAPEKLLEMCTSFVLPDGSSAPLTDNKRAVVLAKVRAMAVRGLRVLSVAFGPDEEHMIFAGVLGMEDPPREGVAESVRALRRGGVKVMMVTGDSRETAIAIAERCGILDKELGEEVELTERLLPGSDKLVKDIESGAAEAMSGVDIESITPEKLPKSIQGVRVFYRVAPRQKLSIVRALQANGDIVAMTGDGA